MSVLEREPFETLARAASSPARPTMASGRAWTPRRTSPCSRTAGRRARRGAENSPKPPWRSRDDRTPHLRHRRDRCARRGARPHAARARRPRRPPRPRRTPRECARTRRTARRVRPRPRRPPRRRAPGRAIGEHEIDSVFHLAAQTIVGIARRSPVSTYGTNVRGTWLLMEACRTHEVQRVVVAASDKAYGASDVLRTPRISRSTRPPVRREQGRDRPHHSLVRAHLRRAGGHDALRQPLRPGRPEPVPPHPRGDRRRARGTPGDHPVRRPRSGPALRRRRRPAYLAIADSSTRTPQPRSARLQRRHRSGRARDRLESSTRSSRSSARVPAPSTAAAPAFRRARSTAGRRPEQAPGDHRLVAAGEPRGGPAPHDRLVRSR